MAPQLSTFRRKKKELWQSVLTAGTRRQFQPTILLFHVWEIATGIRLAELAGEAAPVVFSFNSQRILTAQADGTINVGGRRQWGPCLWR